MIGVMGRESSFRGALPKEWQAVIGSTATRARRPDPPAAPARGRGESWALFRPQEDNSFPTAVFMRRVERLPEFRAITVMPRQADLTGLLLPGAPPALPLRRLEGEPPRLTL